jgi:hypothetical protein
MTIRNCSQTTRNWCYPLSTSSTSGGRPSETILQLALKLKADLIFMGLRRSTHVVAAPQTHWATAYEMVCGASSPVLTARTQ